ncbi:MAG: 4Fe-4S dicluster domain-containing protein [Clostridia bacterium]|nr:4Fe-4S dicluster domain-containing protein [Clostridia bacterium]MDD4570916.1 4Fe-4S dicluster domain-containing protein [Clostridia bacterium]
MVVVDLTKASAKNKSVIGDMQAKSGVNLADCYQCGKCSAGCPVALAMDLQPREVIRYMQLGMWDEVLKARTPWLCATCQTCVTRCPHQVDLPSLMEAVRQEAKKKGITPIKELNRFNDLFLNNIRYFGKSHEMVLMGLYNFTTGHLMQDVWSAPHLYFNRKIRIRPHMVKDKASVRKIMAKCLEGGNK